MSIPIINTYNTIHEAYLDVLKNVWFNYEYKSAPRGMPIREITNYVFTITNPTLGPITTLDKERNQVIADYTSKEMALYDSCSNRVEDFAKASKFWEKLANPDGTIASAYGYLLFKNKSCSNKGYECGSGRVEADRTSTKKYAEKLKTYKRTPWEWAKQCLIADKDTRQAILRFSLPEHQWMGTKDFTCTMHGNFLIRENSLHFSVVMRSNDVVKGTPYDSFFFISLIHKMCEELKDIYPGLKIGTYTHMVHSMHAYEKDENTILKMIGWQDEI